MTTDRTRYCIVSDNDGHDYVIEADHVDEWYELDDDQINAGLSWAWPVGGAPNQVTFTNPLIFGEPLTPNDTQRIKVIREWLDELEEIAAIDNPLAFSIHLIEELRRLAGKSR